MSKVKFEVDFSTFWSSEDDASMAEVIRRIVDAECENEIRKHVRAMLTERRSETAKQVAAAMKAQLERLAAKLSN